MRLRPSSPGASTRPPPASAARPRAPCAPARPRSRPLAALGRVSLSESVLGARGAKGLRRAGCRVIFSPLPLSRPTSLVTPLPPLLALPWSRRRPLNLRPSPRRPPGPSPPLPAAGAREPAPPWGRKAAAPPALVRRAGGPRPRAGRGTSARGKAAPGSSGRKMG